MSRPLSATGRPCIWICVGFLMPLLASTRSTAGGSFMSVYQAHAKGQCSVSMSVRRDVVGCEVVPCRRARKGSERKGAACQGTRDTVVRADFDLWNRMHKRIRDASQVKSHVYETFSYPRSWGWAVGYCGHRTRCAASPAAVAAGPEECGGSAAAASSPSRWNECTPHPAGRPRFVGT